MSDNEDLLGDDLGDHSLADYNLGNEEEEQLLADDYEANASHNVPTSIGSTYREPVGVVPSDFAPQTLEYNQMQPETCVPEAECVVPNITVEIPNLPHRHATYAPYEPPPYEESAVVPPPIAAAPAEPPQTVPSEMSSISNADSRCRFVPERAGPFRTPQQRNIPDSLDKVIVPGLPTRGRNTWRHPQYRTPHPYRRQNYRGNYTIRHTYPPPQPRPAASGPLQLAPEPEIRPELPAKLIPDPRLELPPMGPEVSPERPILPQEMPLLPRDTRPYNQRPRYPFRTNIEEPNFVPNVPPAFERPMFYQRPPFNPRYAPPARDIVPSNNIPQVTIHQPGPGVSMMPRNREPEVRMLPVQLPPNLPPGGLAGKKVLINPHFKGNFQAPIDGPIKDIDDAAERFIAEQRSALARAAGRKFARRSPQRYIENTTIEIENDLARRSEDELLRKQEEFINANRAGLRRRMRTPSPPRRSPSPRRARPPPAHDEDSEYRRRVREQETLRERVLRAKEVRRRKNAVALQKQLQERGKEPQKEVVPEKPKEVNEPEAPPKEVAKPVTTPTQEQQVKPDTTRKTPEREKEKEVEKKEKEVPEKGVEQPEKIERERSPHRVESAEANSTCEGLTPPRETLTPPLDDDELELILGDIDCILSDDDEKPAPKKPLTDLRTKLPPKPAEEKKPQRQKIVFNEDKDAKKKKERSPLRRTVVTINKNANTEKEKTTVKVKPKLEVTTTSTVKSRQKITFDKQNEKEKDEKKPPASFANRRVIIQRKTTKEKVYRGEEADPSKPHPGIFSRAVTAIGADVRSEPQIEFESDSDDDAVRPAVGGGGNVALVVNLPPGMTDTRLGTLAGNQVQSLNLDKEERSAKITFKTTGAAEIFKRKFNNKMVSASRLTVTLR